MLNYLDSISLSLLFNFYSNFYLLGLIASGVIPLPRDMNFPLEKHEDWFTKYDMIRIPTDISNKPSMLKSTFDKQDKSSYTKSIVFLFNILKHLLYQFFFIFFHFFPFSFFHVCGIVCVK